MSARIILLLVLASIVQAQNPLRSPAEALDRRGVSLSLDCTSDLLGGSGSSPNNLPLTSQQWLDLGARVRLERFTPALAHTELFFSVHLNGSLNSSFADSEQLASGIATHPGLRIAEAWLQQSLDPHTVLRLGKIDGNRDFAFIENGMLFLNSAAGYDPAFFALPNYSDTRPGAELLLTRNKLHLNVAAFSPIEGTGALLMQEAGADWAPGGYGGRVSIGAWQITGKVPTLSGNNHRGAYGGYLVSEQKFWEKSRSAEQGAQSLAAYMQLGATPGDYGPFTRHTAFGIVWNAPIARRDRDAAGIAWSRGNFPDALRLRDESAYELFYRIQTSAVSFTPDLQYIAHPAGVTGRNILVGGLRVSYSFSSRTE
jgi:carbohydrate-selective porin OprB